MVDTKNFFGGGQHAPKGSDMMEVLCTSVEAVMQAVNHAKH